MPVWHASVSLQGKKGPLDREWEVERFAGEALAGVGDPDREWWLFSEARIGHLRVPVTPAEYLLVPEGCVIADAGDTGPERPRTFWP